jgi:hypothetical protein
MKLKTKKIKLSLPTQEKLPDLQSVVDMLVNSYRTNLMEMSLFLAIKTSDNSYFIFQQLQSVPIVDFYFNEVNNSISIESHWPSCGKLKYVMPIKGEDIRVNKSPCIINFSDISSNKSEIKLNHLLDSSGEYPKRMFVKKVKEIDDFYTENDIRIEHVNRVYCYDNHFEIFSDNLAVLGIKNEMYFLKENGSPQYPPYPSEISLFPYSVSPPKENLEEGIYSKENVIGGHFSILQENKSLYNHRDFLYYWEDKNFKRNEENIEEDEFAFELRTGKKQNKVPNVGQSYKEIDIDD